MTDPPSSLASNRFFNEYVLLDPATFERMRQRGQRGAGKLDYNEAFDDRRHTEPPSELVPDDDPRNERLKSQYLLTYNDYDTVLNFSRMRQLQKKLEEHLTQDIPPPPGTSVFSITDAIRKIKMAYKDRFARMLGKTAMSRIVDTHQLPPSTASTSGKRKRKNEINKKRKPLFARATDAHIAQNLEFIVARNPTI